MHGMPIQAERGVMLVERREREALKASLYAGCGGRPLHALVLRDLCGGGVDIIAFHTWCVQWLRRFNLLQRLIPHPRGCVMCTVERKRV